jgi:predicted nucleic acid-binding protein
VSWLLDTCVLSEYTRKAPAPQVIRWLDEQDEASLFISVISLGEIRKGIVELSASDRRRSQKLTAWLGKVEQRFAERTLALDAAELTAWARISAQAELAGRHLAVMDGLLMATAQCHGFTVVTRNVQDFASFPHVLNPWTL